MKLFMIRHGRQSSRLCNVNVELSEAGYRQAALLGERLACRQIETVYSSDLLRAVQTAGAANLYWNVEHMIKPELREISFGDMEGLSDETIALKYSEFKKEQNRMVEDIPYPGGECAGDVVKRAMPAFLEIAESGAKQVAVITHGGLIRSLTAAMIGLDLHKHRMLGSTIENCSITEFKYHPESRRFTLERFNDYAHLEKYPELLRAGWARQEN